MHCDHLDSAFSAESCGTFLFYFICFHAFQGGRSQNLLHDTNVTIHVLFRYYSYTVYGTHSHFIQKKNIKNRSHGTIHTFKNYFVIVFSVFSFSNNKLNSNGPITYLAINWFTFHSKKKKKIAFSSTHTQKKNQINFLFYTKKWHRKFVFQLKYPINFPSHNRYLKYPINFSSHNRYLRQFSNNLHLKSLPPTFWYSSTTIKSNFYWKKK